ncbi:uncharacterized protein I206_101671 [Kwoniella pini CBS 10737]|uniref:Translation initiation factor 3 N-terminal domain-containing protein n=1 Tax=Kwoniella pini CBS 10737 TaxID=1296096 RepID=A0A1B9HW22_9TREE|nr:uncharacterized protein I206_06360 [Kwoniella pini CBS 10737]OCF47459.1 hypothetical protein I206_06360 [Kwoniella pini CBS 10737]
MASRIYQPLRSAILARNITPHLFPKANILPSGSTAARQASSSSSTFGLRNLPPHTSPPNASTVSFRDGAIPYRTVQLVDPETNHLLEPQTLRSILSTYDQNTHTLVLVNIEKEIPIVKLINKVEERQKERESEEKARLKKRMSIEEKEVQISWQSAQGDLLHKLNLAKSLLEKGDRVQVVFANRKRGENIGENKKQEIISTFHEELEQIGKKWKDDEIKGSIHVLFYNPLETTRNQVQNKVKDQENAKRKEKEEKKEARRRKEEERRAKAEARNAAKEQAQEAANI